MRIPSPGKEETPGPTLISRLICQSSEVEGARNLPGSKLITEAWKIIDIKSITEKGLLLEEIEEPGID